jgi:hypothetical protein
MSFSRAKIYAEIRAARQISFYSITSSARASNRLSVLGCESFLKFARIGETDDF